MLTRLASTTLRIGDEAPPFALPGLDGEVVELAEARGICGVILLFTPGAWSPATRRQLGEVNAVYEQFRENGIQVVVLMTQSASALRDRLSSYAIPFPILADERKEAAREYGVFRAVSWDGLGITRPAVFMVDREGILRFVYVGQGSTDVMETESLLKLAVWLVGVAPIEDVPQEEIELDLDEAAADVELVLDEDGTVIAELYEAYVPEDEPDVVVVEDGVPAEIEPADGTPAPGDAEVFATDIMAVDANGNGQHSDSHTADGETATPADADDGNGELSVAGAAERPGTDHPRA